MFCSLFSRFPNPFLKGIRRVKTAGKTIYLTFDDGPTPEITEQILYILYRYNVKATFFCCGKNADENPDLLARIKSEGHSVGYHSYSHLDILKTKPSLWFADVERKSSVSDCKMFRPPYGRISFVHYLKLRKKYDFVFWDVMSYDYDSRFGPNEIMGNLEKSVRNGSVVIFHDNLKSEKNTLEVLPKFIEKIQNDGYEFSVLYDSAFFKGTSKSFRNVYVENIK